VIGPKSGWPVIFGVARDPGDAWRAIKRGHWDLHDVHAFCWTPGKPTAERLKAKLAERLTAYCQFENPEWYNVSVAEILSHIEDIARRERIELFDNVEKERRVAMKADAKVDAKVLPFLGGKPLRLVKS
jgi:hypothetical protein